jgi:hypothetical protein
MGDSLTAATDWVGQTASDVGDWFTGGSDVLAGADTFGGGGGFDVFEAGAGWDPGSTAQAVAGGASDLGGGWDQLGGGTFLGSGGAAAGDIMSGGSSFTDSGAWGLAAPDSAFDALDTFQPMQPVAAAGGGFLGGGTSAASSLPSFAGGGGGDASMWGFDPTKGPMVDVSGVNPLTDVGAGGGGFDNPLGGMGQYALDFAKANPGLLIGGGLLASQALGQKGPKTNSQGQTANQQQVQRGAESIQQQGQDLSQRGQEVSAPAQARLAETQGTLSQQGAQNSAALAGTAPLPMGAQRGIDQATNAAVAQIRSQMAGLGLNGSSMEAQLIAQAKIKGQQQAFEQAKGLADLGFRQTVAGSQINDSLSRTGLGMETGGINAQGGALQWFNNVAQQELQDDQALSDAIARFATALPGAVVLPGQQGRTRRAA